MMKSVKILAMAATVALLAAPCVSAMDTLALKVEVPFDFVVGDEAFPSGKYRIVKGTNAHVVRIYSRTQDRRIAAPCVMERAAVTKGWQLVFHKHDGQYFLKSIGTADGLGLVVPESRLERAAEATAGASTVATR